MSKVIVDTYRYGRPEARAIVGSRRRFRNRLDSDGEGGLNRLGMHADIFSYHHRKQPGDRISPLRRYLVRQVLRPWDVVHLEICRLADLRSVIQWHLRLHLELLVETKTVLLDGQVVLPACNRHRPVSESSCAVYVHPVTRLLMLVR